MEKIVDILGALIKDANWGQILGILIQTVQTFLRLIGVGS